MPVAASLAFALAVGGATAWSAGTREPASGFVEGGHGPAPLIGDARTEGYETLRLLSGPSAMTGDPLNEPAKTLLVLVGAARPYTAEEVGAVQSFLADGGRLLVADNFGQANSLTSAIGITFERVRLVEPSAT